MSSNTVVSKVKPIGEQEFHLALVCGLHRCARRLGGMGALADALDITPPGLRKLLNGSVPCLKRVLDAQGKRSDGALDDILDDVTALYERKFITMLEAQRSNATLPLAAALHKVAAAESDGIKTDAELLDMEDELRAAGRMIDALLDRIAEVRRPRAVQS